MAVEEFKDDENGFREWMVRHPNGYVVNVDRDYSDRDGARIHRASCTSLQPGAGGGDRQTESYVKICSWDSRELDKWAQANLGSGVRELVCRLCTPSDIGLT